MAIISESIEGTKIKNIIESANLAKTEYDVETECMIAEFKNGSKYEYEKVPHKIYAQFRLSESQGKFFYKRINNKKEYPFHKEFTLYPNEVKELKEIVENKKESIEDNDE